VHELVITAYRELMRFEFYLARSDFAALHQKVCSCPVNKTARRHWSIRQVCRAIDLASICYWKRVLCLQRSAATVCLLKKSGIAAELVIGVQQVPFEAHAWVEVDGAVVNDKPCMRESYAVLDRC
jgi:Transglutaminase-like superfamily